MPHILLLNLISDQLARQEVWHVSFQSPLIYRFNQQPLRHPPFSHTLPSNLRTVAMPLLALDPKEYSSLFSPQYLSPLSLLGSLVLVDRCRKMKAPN